MIELFSNGEDKITYQTMRLKISNENNIIQAGHSKVSFYVPAGTYTIKESVDGEHWSTVDASCDGDKTVNMGGLTPTVFLQITENSGAEWEGTAIGVNKID